MSTDLVSPFGDHIIERYILDSDSVRDKQSRYRFLFRVRDDEMREYQESWDSVIIPPAEDDIYWEVPVAYEHRIDLISWHFYSTTLLWWAIMLASGLEDPFDLPVGTVLTIPSRQNLFNLNLIG